MEAVDNVSTVMQFVLLQFSDIPVLQGLLFHLNPMKVNLCTQNRSISMLTCATQMCFFLILGATEGFHLAMMAYDHYMAICNSLHYPLVMNHKMCIQLAVGSWISGIPVQIGQTCQISSLHFYTSVHELSIYVVALLFGAVPFMLILASCNKITSNILRLPTARDQAKAFSTCSSHLLVVLLFFGSLSITYFRPKSSHSAGIYKLLSLFYTIMTLIFNPKIYCLGNKDVIAALRKLFIDNIKPLVQVGNVDSPGTL
uniref:G-protein coupled receptors family 1 profile domain-containing protein n=1 Tax=Sus scrofa TaxID=9823 RepID=A0A8D0LS82_PIG